MFLITEISYRLSSAFSVNVYGIKFGTIAKLPERCYLMCQGQGNMRILFYLLVFIMTHTKNQTTSRFQDID